MKFFRAIRPGEQIDLRAEKLARTGDLVQFRVEASISGLRVAEGQLVLSVAANSRGWAGITLNLSESCQAQNEYVDRNLPSSFPLADEEECIGRVLDELSCAIDSEQYVIAVGLTDHRIERRRSRVPVVSWCRDQRTRIRLRLSKRNRFGCGRVSVRARLCLSRG